MLDALLVTSTLLGPVLAVQAQKWVESWRADADRRLAVFKTLMGTRGAPVSPQHVQALNMIDLEFQGERFREVREAWSNYLDHLSNVPRLEDTAVFATWSAKSPDLLARLLVRMGESVGYRFGEVDIKRSIYVPRAHGDEELKQEQMRTLAFEVLSHLKVATAGGALLVSDRDRDLRG